MTSYSSDELVDHLVQAAEHVRQANHATHSGSRTIPDLYHAIGALVSTMNKLPQQLNYLYVLVSDAHQESERYYHDNGDEVDVERVLATAKHEIGYADEELSNVIADLNSAWSHLGRIGVREGPTT